MCMRNIIAEANRKLMAGPELIPEGQRAAVRLSTGANIGKDAKKQALYTMVGE